MTSGTVGILAFLLTVGMGIILELAKCGFLFESLSNTKLSMPIRIIMAGIALLLVGASILASASYVQNQANKTKNIQTKTSSQYKQLEQGKALQQDLYNTKKQEIEDLKALQQKQQEEGERIISSMPKNYTDRRNQQRADTQKQIARTQETINQKSTELSQIGANLQAPIDTTNLKINSDNGYTAMFETIADIINDSEEYKGHPIKPEVLEMWFFIGLGIIFELVAVITAYLSQLKSTHPQGKAIEKDTIILNEGIGFKPQVITASKDNGFNDDYIQAKRQIGFQAAAISSVTAATMPGHKTEQSKSLESLVTPNTYNDSNINQDDLRKYIEYMYATLRNGTESKGYNPIGQDTGIGIENARKIKAYLERLGIVRTVGTKTFVLLDLQACKGKLQA